MTGPRDPCPEERRRDAINLYDRYTHEGMDRRAFMAELTRIAGGTGAAAALLTGISASPAAAALTDAADKRLDIRREVYQVGDGRELSGYGAEPKGRASRASVMVVHENRGLNAHIEDVARRVALAGYHAFAPDFLSPIGGTPADQDEARAAIGKLDLAQATADGAAVLGVLRRRPDMRGRVGVVGFCWGGAMVSRLAVAAGAALDAGVVFYGTAPSGAEAIRVQAPLLIHLAARDERVNKSALPWVVALRNAGKRVRAVNYQDVDHAFHNDTSAERYNKAAADRAWATTLSFFKQHLA